MSCSLGYVSTGCVPAVSTRDLAIRLQRKRWKDTPSNPAVRQCLMPVDRQGSCYPDMLGAELPWPPIVIIAWNQTRSEVVHSPRRYQAASIGSPSLFQRAILCQNFDVVAPGKCPLFIKKGGGSACSELGLPRGAAASAVSCLATCRTSNRSASDARLKHGGLAYRFQGIFASSMPMPQVSVMPANINPAPTKAASPIQ